MHDCFTIELTGECLKCLFRLTGGVPAVVVQSDAQWARIPEIQVRIPSRAMGTFFPHTVRSIFRLSLTHTHTHTHARTHARTRAHVQTEQMWTRACLHAHTSLVCEFINAQTKKPKWYLSIVQCSPSLGYQRYHGGGGSSVHAATDVLTLHGATSNLVSHSYNTQSMGNQ